MNTLRGAVPALACLLVFTSTGIRAEVGDPTIRTSHPQYAGEGAFQDVDDCVHFATAGAHGEQDRAIALYLWLLGHQYHLMSPQEWNVPRLVPDTAKDGRADMIVSDANRARYSYGYGLCGTVHAWNEPYWQALGMRARRRAFPGHTNSEVEYGGSWHAFDTDMAGLVLREDGSVAGYEDVVADPQLAALPHRSELPCYPFAWPGDFQTMRSGWAEVARGGNWFRMYNSGYAAQPGIVRLRSGETFTRYFDRDHFGGPTKRRFWHNFPGGPFRNWTFVNMGEPRHVGDDANARGNASYCNAEFVYRPHLGDERCREGVVQATDNVSHRETSPRLHSVDGGKASVTFRHFSPYVICGDPEDDADPMTKPATGGLVVSGKSIGAVRVEVSADEGQTWTDLGTVGNAFSRDLTDHVKGRYGWRVRLTWEGRGGLDELIFTTVCQVNQAMYPRLTPGGCQVTYRAASRDVVPVLPNLGVTDGETTVFEEQSLRSPNVAYAPRSEQSRLAYRTTNNKPGTVVFRIDSPTPLTQIRAAVQYQVRVPPPEDCDYHLDVSTDGGRTWREFARADIPADNEYSSGWLAGRADVADAGTKAALVRAHFYQGGYQTGLIDAALYGIREVSPPQEVVLTYGWRENGEPREHVEHIAAEAEAVAFDVETGASIVDHFVRLQVP